MRRLMFVISMLVLLSGCASNPRFATDVPASHISGEQVCEVPQHWKALALSGIDTRTLLRARVLQVKVPPSFVGDALGWFVEGEEARTLTHYPRYVWSALVINKRTGEKQFAPAIMKNPLVAPVLTVVVTDPKLLGEDELMVYVPSGAYTKLLTAEGDLLTLPTGKDCLTMVDAEFVRMFPSLAKPVSPNAEGRILEGVRADFTKPSLQSDGVVYSLHPLAMNQKVVGDLRQVTQGERILERGLTVAIPHVIPTIISVGVAFATTGEDRYVGPFGERLYSSPEAEAALGRFLRGYNALKEDLETRLGMNVTRPASITLLFDGRKSGWEVGEVIALQVTALWQQMDRLKQRIDQVHARSRKGNVATAQEANPNWVASKQPTNPKESP